MKKPFSNTLRAMLFLLGNGIIFLFFIGCGPNYIFQKKYNLSNQQWMYQDTLNFEVVIKDTTAIYNIFLNVEHHVEYPKQNLYALIYTKFPLGERLKEQVSLELANKMGRWNGDCSGNWCQVQIPLQEGAFFNQTGSYTFTVEQFMRINPLSDIKSVSLSIEDTGQRR